MTFTASIRRHTLTTKLIQPPDINSSKGVRPLPVAMKNSMSMYEVASSVSKVSERVLNKWGFPKIGDLNIVPP